MPDTDHSPSTDRLDQLDELINRFLPIEQLFRLIGAAGADLQGGELLRCCSGIGLTLTEDYLKYLVEYSGRALELKVLSDVVTLTCRVSSNHSILEGCPLVQVIPDHTDISLTLTFAFS
jgi:hypothetical protein